MTEIAALSAPHTLPLGSRGRHHSLYAWLLLLPLDMKPMIRSTSSGVLLYLTFAPVLTAVLIHPLQSCPILLRRYHSAISSNPRRFIVGKEDCQQSIIVLVFSKMG